MKVLFSIKPEYADKILSGEKKFEFRKSIFKNPGVTTVVIYATKPLGKVVGEFDIERILASCPESLWIKTEKHSGITRDFFNEYFKNRDLAFAIKVKSARRYKNPLDLIDVLPTNTAPQSFCYLS